MTLDDLFFIHIPKTGGTYVKFSLPELPCSRKFNSITHATVNEAAHLIENRTLFTVVRNPYDWLESFYYWNINGAKVRKRNPEVQKYTNFQEFILDKGFVHLGMKQSDYLCNKVLPENILKTENLTAELSWFLKTNGITTNVLQDPIRVNTLKEKVYWTNKMKLIVQDYYEEDFKLGYL